MKLSYLIASIHGETAVKTIIEDIYALPKHEFEIIVCSPSLIKDSRAKWVEDDKLNGCVYAYNKAYSISQGDCLVVATDENHIPINFLETIDFLESDIVKNLKLKIANLTYGMGGPGKLYYIKNDKTNQPAKNILWPLHGIIPEGFPNCRPFNVFHYPVIMRESVVKYMSNKIFNESFIHHYPDSWMGFYEEMINGDRSCEELGPKNVYLTAIEEINQQNPNSKFDSKDKNTFLELVKLSNSENFNYNTKI